MLIVRVFYRTYMHTHIRVFACVCVHIGVMYGILLQLTVYNNTTPNNAKRFVFLLFFIRVPYHTMYFHSFFPPSPRLETHVRYLTDTWYITVRWSDIPGGQYTYVCTYLPPVWYLPTVTGVCVYPANVKTKVYSIFILYSPLFPQCLSHVYSAVSRAEGIRILGPSSDRRLAYCTQALPNTYPLKSFKKEFLFYKHFNPPSERLTYVF